MAEPGPRYHASNWQVYVTRWLINLVYGLAGLCYLPVLFYQMIFQCKNRSGWGERFGSIRLPNVSGRRIWVHAVSLGEVNAARLVVERLRADPRVGDVVISTTTDTGYARARALFGDPTVFRFPLDFSWIIHRALNRIQPTAIVLVELEVWPNLVAMAGARGIPVAVINGRLTERSARRLRRVGRLTRPMFKALAWVGTQDEAIAQRFGSVGVPADRISVTGSVKWDTVTMGSAVEGQEKLAMAMGYLPPLTLWVCGSTGEQDGVAEEMLVLDAYRMLRQTFPQLHLVLVPRKPERFDAVARMITQSGYSLIRRTERKDGVMANGLIDMTASVSLGDTVGELRKFYGLADVVFVGRSLVPMGGSDPMEVAALGKPMIFGPHMENFKEPVARLKEAGAAVQLSRAGREAVDELAQSVGRWLAEPDGARSTGERGQQVVRSEQGATDRTVSHLLKILEAAD